MFGMTKPAIEMTRRWDFYLSVSNDAV